MVHQKLLDLKTNVIHSIEDEVAEARKNNKPTECIDDLLTEKRLYEQQLEKLKGE